MHCKVCLDPAKRAAVDQLFKEGVGIKKVAIATGFASTTVWRHRRLCNLRKSHDRIRIPDHRVELVNLNGDGAITSPEVDPNIGPRVNDDRPVVWIVVEYFSHIVTNPSALLPKPVKVAEEIPAIVLQNPETEPIVAAIPEPTREPVPVPDGQCCGTPTLQNISGFVRCQTCGTQSFPNGRPIIGAPKDTREHFSDWRGVGIVSSMLR